ncbi:MAG: HPr family phosphocarrier protein [Planctomycetota bacterium]
MSANATARVVISNQLGLHARPATLFADVAAQFAADVRVTRGTESVDGKSIMHLMMLAATKGTELLVEATGADADACVNALRDLINRGFDED